MLLKSATGVVFYTIGFVIHSIYQSNNAGWREVNSYHAAVRNKTEHPYNSIFDAFWTGCRKGLVWSLFDSIIWPVKSIAYVYYVSVEKN